LAKQAACSKFISHRRLMIQGDSSTYLYASKI